MNRPIDTMNESEKSALWRLAWLGFAMMFLFGALSLISQPFEYSETTRKPILEVVGLLISATVLSIFSVRAGIRIDQNGGALLLLIVSMAIGFRVVMGFTPPILEIDFYRYMWDGKVSVAGVSPYRYSPQQIIDAGGPGPKAKGVSPDLEKLVDLSLASAANHEILTRVHFAQHTTIYPPVSQVVFYLVGQVTPAEASTSSQTLVMRAMLVAFDLGTIFVLLLILRAVGRHPAWLIAYAWNPLVVKEISNSIHLDSIAIFFMMLAILFVIQARTQSGGRKPATFGGLSLGLAVGAKLFPVVIAPAIAVALLKYGKPKVVLFSVAFLATTSVVLYPMLSKYEGSPPTDLEVVETLSPEDRSLRLLEQASDMATQEPNSVAENSTNKDGLTSFLSSWRMNDVIFSTVYHNLKPIDDPQNEYWYVVVPNEVRQQIENSAIADVTENPAFLLTRIATLAAFAIIYLCFLPRFHGGNDLDVLAGLLFLLFSFLMLQPTVNPWYWVWAIPLTCFSSRWGWIGVSAILTIYYTRFFFDTSELAFTVNQHTYLGVDIFDHFVVWGEAILITLFIMFTGRLDFENPIRQHSST